jgi:hypothetical protein
MSISISKYIKRFWADTSEKSVGSFWKGDVYRDAGRQIYGDDPEPLAQLQKELQSAEDKKKSNITIKLVPHSKLSRGFNILHLPALLLNSTRQTLNCFIDWICCSGGGVNRAPSSGVANVLKKILGVGFFLPEMFCYLFFTKLYGSDVDDLIDSYVGSQGYQEKITKTAVIRPTPLSQRGPVPVLKKSFSAGHIPTGALVKHRLNRSHSLGTTLGVDLGELKV